MSLLKSREERDHERFLKSPPGQARLSRERGDVVFQATIDLAAHHGTIEVMVGGRVTTHPNDATAVLNAICAEGWDLITGTVVFVPGMQESRDKFMSSGQQIAISGSTVGYYLFRRRSADA